ncbi:MAG: DedA family protein [Candidatus Buchananbacteria bacterium]
MISGIIDILANIIISIIGYLGYTGVFLLMFLESCGLPIPSEIIMPFAGFLVAKGQLSFFWVGLLGSLGNLAGSALAYYIGLWGGRPLIEKYGKWFLISKHDLNLADHWFNKYGDWAVFFGRLLPVVRTYISFPAGIAKMDIKKFCFYSFIGALPWCFLFAWLGIKMGNNWELIREKLHAFDMTILALVILMILLYVWRHLKNLKKI